MGTSADLHAAAQMTAALQGSPHGSPRASMSSPSADPFAEIITLREQVAQLVQFAQQQQRSQAAAASHQSSSSSHAPSGSRIKPPPIARFAGQVGAEVDTFIRDLKLQFDVFGPIDELSRIRYAGTYFTGHAAEWWDKEDKAAITKWEEFVARLHLRFRPRNAASVARSRMRHLKQRGAVSAYAGLFMSLLSQTPTMHVDDQIECFIEGLSSADIRHRVLEKDAKTIQEAIECAVRAEQFTKGSGSAAHFRAGGHSYHAANSGATSNADAMDINAVAQQEGDFDEFDSPAPPPRNAVDPLAAILSKMDVMEQRILVLSGGGSSSSSSSRKDLVPGLKGEDIERMRKEGRCFRCQKKGHMKGDCPDKPKRSFH
jgi:hypothetical protein